MRRGELDRAEGARATALAGLWVCGRPKGCRRGLGLRLPSESLLWLLGGVGGKCRCSTEAEGKKAGFIHQTATKQDPEAVNQLHVHTAERGSAEQRDGDSACADREGSPVYFVRGERVTSRCRMVYKGALLLYERGEQGNTDSHLFVSA